MPLLGAGRLISYLIAYRIAHIQGRLGGGKSSLAVRLAAELMGYGYRFGSNMACIWNEPLENITLMPDGMLHAVFVGDEAGNYFEEREHITTITSYAGKLDVIYLLPSFIEPHRSARVVKIQPLYSYYGFGLPLIMYQWKVRQNDYEEKGIFHWFTPEEIYGVYSRQHPGYSAFEILEHVKRQAELFEVFHRTRATLLGTGIPAALPATSTAEEARPEFEVRGMAEARRAHLDLELLRDEIEEEANALKAIFVRAAKLNKKLRRRKY